MIGQRGIPHSVFTIQYSPFISFLRSCSPNKKSRTSSADSHALPPPLPFPCVDCLHQGWQQFQRIDLRSVMRGVEDRRFRVRVHRNRPSPNRRRGSRQPEYARGPCFPRKRQSTPFASGTLIAPNAGSGGPVSGPPGARRSPSSELPLRPSSLYRISKTPQSEGFAQPPYPLPSIRLG